MTAAVLLLLFAAPGRFDQIAKQAAEARESNRGGEAIRLYRQALQLYPNWGEGWWYVGSLLYEEDKYGEAIPVFIRYLKIEDKSAPGWTMLGLCEYQQKDYATALQHLLAGKALGMPEANQMAGVARYHRALLDTHFGRYEAALDELKKFTFPAAESPAVIQAAGLAALHMPLLPTEISPPDREIVAKTGRAVFDSWAARPADAEREFRELLAGHPDNANLHYLYGSYLLQSHPDDGLLELQKCLGLDAKYVPAMLQIAFEYLTRHEPAKGIAAAENAIELNPESFVAHNALGRLLLEHGDVDRAISELKTAVTLAPEVPECHFSLASAYTKAGRKQDAAKENAEFIRLNKVRTEAEEKTKAEQKE